MPREDARARAARLLTERRVMIVRVLANLRPGLRARRQRGAARGELGSAPRLAVLLPGDRLVRPRPRRRLGGPGRLDGRAVDRRGGGDRVSFRSVLLHVEGFPKVGWLRDIHVVAKVAHNRAAPSAEEDADRYGIFVFIYWGGEQPPIPQPVVKRPSARGASRTPCSRLRGGLQPFTRARAGGIAGQELDHGLTDAVQVGAEPSAAPARRRPRPRGSARAGCARCRCSCVRAGALRGARARGPSSRAA